MNRPANSPAIHNQGSPNLLCSFPMSRPAKANHAALGITRHGFDRNGDFNNRPWVGAPNPQFPAEFLDALSHAANAHANAVRAPLHYSISNALAIVTHRSHYLNIVPHQRHPRFARSRMSKHIGYSLLNDAEYCGLHLWRKSRKIGWLHLQQDFNSAALCEPLKIKLKRRL